MEHPHFSIGNTSSNGPCLGDYMLPTYHLLGEPFQQPLIKGTSPGTIKLAMASSNLLFVSIHPTTWMSRTGRQDQWLGSMSYNHLEATYHGL